TLHLAYELQSIGLACTRLANIVKINEELTLNRATATDDLITTALESVLDEMSADLANQLPGPTK
ncbi:MAG: hypothetical protein MUO67_11845, partial [Anaerolineales bacterium]|nr:hypothetical protein [Anaerolineales bacterium]